MRKILPVIVIFVLAFTLRVVNIGRFPAGFSADEASQGYTAYSILKPVGMNGANFYH